MCQYADFPVIHQECEANPKHVVVKRWYNVCKNPQNISTYRHCDDDHATPAEDFLFGSSKAHGPCPTCADAAKTMIIVSFNPSPITLASDI